jgi:hypothetical protein
MVLRERMQKPFLDGVPGSLRVPPHRRQFTYNVYQRAHGVRSCTYGTQTETSDDVSTGPR